MQCAFWRLSSKTHWSVGSHSFNSRYAHIWYNSLCMIIGRPTIRLLSFDGRKHPAINYRNKSQFPVGVFDKFRLMVHVTGQKRVDWYLCSNWTNVLNTRAASGDAENDSNSQYLFSFEISVRSHHRYNITNNVDRTNEASLKEIPMFRLLCTHSRLDVLKSVT